MNDANGKLQILKIGSTSSTSNQIWFTLDHKAIKRYVNTLNSPILS